MNRRVNSSRSSAAVNSRCEQLRQLIDESIDSERAGEILNVCSVRVQQFAREKRLHGVQIAGRWRFFEEDVMAFAKIERPPGRPTDRS